MQEIMLNTKNLKVIADSVDDIIVSDLFSNETNSQNKKLEIEGVILGIIFKKKLCIIALQYFEIK
jgi:hypothetical protein